MMGSAMKILDLIAERLPEKYALHEQYLNGQIVKVLKTIGYDVAYTEARGPYLFDAQGNRYLDLLSGWGVFALGRNHPRVVETLSDVLHGRLPHLVQMDVTILAGLLAERLVAKMPPGLDKVFFCNSGAESVEAALKFARYATRRSKVVFVERGYHGLTYGALSINGMEEFREGFGPLLPDCVRVPFDDLPALERALAGRDVAAFVVEPIVGHGVHIPRDEYLPGAAALCRKYGTLLVCDEVQTGLGRTGKFLAVEHWGVEPDMICLAKALSAGFVPVGAVACRKWVFDAVFDRMDRAVVHGSTYSKNNLAMAAGLAVLEVLDEEKLVENAASVGAQIVADLTPLVAKHEFLKDVRGKGMMIALEFGKPDSFKLKAAWKLLEAANDSLFGQLITVPLFTKHRILSQIAGHHMHIVKFLPPLGIGQEDRRWITSACEQTIADAHQVGGAVWDLGKQLAGAAIKMQRGR
jgi:ornithine--oxo-acid transaminase